MGKDDSVLEKQALLSQKRAAEIELSNIEAKKRAAEDELSNIEAKKRAAGDELSNIEAKLVAINAVIEKKRMFEEHKETLGRGPARGMDLVKKVAELNLQAEN